ncbi:MAG: hypothetical protein J6D02_10905 [Lachnospira sp.]|nr:hypothetical protein [Lachnospira sp.]
MINFEEEIKKFKPSLEIEDVENAVYENEMQDIMDVMQMMAEQGNDNESQQ